MLTFSSINYVLLLFFSGDGNQISINFILILSVTQLNFFLSKVLHFDSCNKTKIQKSTMDLLRKDFVIFQNVKFRNLCTKTQKIITQFSKT